MAVASRTASVWAVCAFVSMALVLHPDLYPRSWLVFGILALPGIVISAAVLSEEITPSRTIQYTLAGIYNALIVRLGPFLVIPYSGGDHLGLYQRIARTLATGERIGGGNLYQYATHFPIGSAVIAAVSGLYPPRLRFASLIVAATFPWLLAGLVYKMSEDGRAAVLTGVFGSYFPLLLRTSSLVEAEYMVLWYFLTVLFALFLILRLPTTRSTVLLLVMMATSVLVHFFYALAILGITVLTLVILSWFGPNSLAVPRVSRVLTIGGMVALTRILWSEYADVSVGMAAGSAAAASSGPTSLLAFFIPMSGTAAAGTGTGGAGQPLVMQILKYLPLLLPLLLAAIGGLYLLYWRRENPLVAVGVAVVVATIGLAIVSGPSGKQFRAYYFVGLIATAFAGIGVSVIFRTPSRRSLRVTVAVVLVALISVVAVVGPATPFGNDVDPQFDSTSFAIPQDPSTISQVEQFSDMARDCDRRAAKVVDTGDYVECSRRSNRGG